MKKRIALSVDEDIYEQLKFVPRGFSVSDFVSFMLRGMLQEVKNGRIFNEEEFEKWLNSDPELKRIREGIREAWGPTLYPVIDKINTVTDKMKAKVGVKTKSSKVGPKK
jgi:hypothetical protein